LARFSLFFSGECNITPVLYSLSKKVAAAETICIY